MQQTIEKTIISSNGTRIKISVTAKSPINEASFPILRDAALLNMAECLRSFAEAVKPGEGARDADV